MAGALVAGCGRSPSDSDGTGAAPADRVTSTVVPVSDVEWGPLNPARGDKGPKAATLWGDRTGPGASGFLVEFADGFSSPPHIHNVSYRALVLHGLVHNDDPAAEEMWMPAGSFWTQPKGDVHITAAKGSRNLAYVEIEEGPYLVLPVEKKFDSAEKPIRALASSIDWHTPAGVPATDRSPTVARLWGDPQGNRLCGTLVKLPAGFTGTLRSPSAFRAVVIRGRPEHRVPGASDARRLQPGSCFGSDSASHHPISCGAGEEVILYIRTAGRFDVAPAPSE